MSVSARFRSALRTLLKRQHIAEEIERELRFHLDAHTAELIAQGVAEPEARRLARIALGAPLQSHAEAQRRAVGLQLLDDLLADVRYGLRGLWRNQAFALTAILSLAISIGATTAMFSVVYAVLLDIYPYADSDRTVNPIVHDPGVPDDWSWFVLNREQYVQYKAAPCFEDAFATGNYGIQLDDEEVELPLRVVTLTGNASAFNHVPALLGRALQPSDGDFGDKPSNVVVLGYKFWKRHYFGDKGVIGRDLKAGSNLFRIVGVMPERYTLGGNPDLYMSISQFPNAGASYVAFAKLRRGVTPQQASQFVNPMIHAFAKATPNLYPKDFNVRLQPLLEGFTARSKLLKNFPLLYFAVGSLLLIGCANCSLLLLARGQTRVHEFALRSAVGASRARIVRQMLVECLTLSLLGSALGTGLAYFLARLPLQLAADLFPTEAVIRINGTVLAFSISVAILAGLIFGLLPTLKFSRPKIGHMLQANSRRTVAATGKRPLQALVSAQIALTLVLLTLSGAAIGGFLHLLRLPLGYDPQNMSSVGVGLMKTTVVTSWAERVARINAVQQAIENVPGVISAAYADDLPPSGGGLSRLQLVGSDDRNHEARYTSIGQNYFSTLHIPLLQGRVWTRAEQDAGLPLAVVNQTFLRRFSPQRSVIDRMVRLPALDPADKTRPIGFTLSPAIQNGQARIIGVVADAVNDGLDKPALPGVYVNRNALVYAYAPFLVRTAGDPRRYDQAIAHALTQALGKSYIYINPLSLQELVKHEPTWGAQRLVAVLLGIFAAFAFLLSLVGLYSVVAYAAAQRTPEFGIRMALGAQRADVRWLVVRSNAATVLGGAAIGVLVSLGIRARFEHWSEYSSRSPVPVALAALLLLVAALVASLLPAHRASRIEPNEALRSE